MAGLVPLTPPLTAAQIAARLSAIGYGTPDQDLTAALFAIVLQLLSALNDQGVEIPDQLIDMLDGFDPDEPVTTEGLTQ